MPSDAELDAHEDFRWSRMEWRQLRARLDRITTKDKLSAFIRKARREGDHELLSLAILRQDNLFPLAAPSRRPRTVEPGIPSPWNPPKQEVRVGTDKPREEKPRLRVLRVD